jgi:hypothetical protein
MGLSFRGAHAPHGNFDPGYRVPMRVKVTEHVAADDLKK